MQIDSKERLNAVKEARLRAGGMSQSRFYEEINSGRLRAVKIGRRTFIRESDFLAWLSALPAFSDQAA